MQHTNQNVFQVDTKPKSDFAIMCRELRVSKALKQREVAAAMGVKLSTYGNLECSHWKVVSRDKAAKLIALYSLSPDRAAVLLDAWDRCPLSPHGEKRRENWKKINSFRSKAKNHDPLKLALIELLGLHLMAVPDAEICACDFGTVCGVCKALERLGIDPFTPADRDKILTRLVKIQQDLAPSTTGA
jgi:transcriptional regulator with XRE-family HTH domain